MNEVRNAYNREIFPERYVNIPAYPFDQSVKFIEYTHFVTELIERKVQIDTLSRNPKDYFKANERIFIEYAESKIDENEVWILLACYYLIDKKKINSFTEDEICKTVLNGWGDINRILKFEDSFSNHLFILMLQGWIVFTELDNMIKLNNI